MNTVHVRNVEIGAGKPKIAVSIMGTTQAAILSQAKALHTLPVDVAEWRMDWFDRVDDGAAVQQCLSALRTALGEMPLLATFRTDREGGQRYLSPESYAALNEYVIASGQADLLDVELFSGNEIVPRLIAAAHDANMAVVLSSHDFEKTPSKAEMVSRLCRMQELDADILKLAVMPRCRSDVLTLLQATEEMYTQHAHQPLVTMSMGRLGMVTRVCGETFGSAMTFGAAAKSSAPGQMGAEKLNQVLTLLSSEPL